MTWIKLDDNAVDHPKVETLSDRAFRWWVKGLSYASRFLTNGLLPPVFWKKVPKQSRAELTTHRLWDWVDPDFQIHDYLAHQSSKEIVSQKKADTAERVRKFREAKRNALLAEQCNALPPQVVTPPVTLPDTEIREQRSDTEIREQSVSAPPAPLRPVPVVDRRENQNWSKKHGYHVTGFCDWVCLDEQQAGEFAAKIPGDDHPLKQKQIKEWALDIRRQWADRIIPDGSNFDFWRNRWTETHGGSRPANATLKAAQAAKSIDEAFR